MQACKATELASLDGIEATSLLTLVQMVTSGVGVALLSEMAVQSGLLKPERVVAWATRPTSPHMAEFEAVAKVMTAVSCPSP